MKVARYVSDLLYDYECVVIPGFGGFITKSRSASIHSMHHTFNPPYKEVVFNVHLKANDGLLINHLAHHENLSYAQALKKLEAFTTRCNFELYRGRRIRFKELGVIQQNNHGQLIFFPEKEINFEADSYGLSPFVSPPVKRDSRMRFERKPLDRKPRLDQKTKEIPRLEVYKKPKYVRINLLGMLLASGVIIGGALYFNQLKNAYSQYSGFIPVFSNTLDEYLFRNREWIPLEKLEIIPEFEKAESGFTSLLDFTTKSSVEETHLLHKEGLAIEPGKEVYAGETSPTETPEIGIPLEEDKTISSVSISQEDSSPDLQDFNYCIVAGAFSTHANAEKCIGELIAKGYQATIIGTSANGLFRVCYNRYKYLSEANSALAIIRKNENESAWILKI